MNWRDNKDLVDKVTLKGRPIWEKLFRVRIAYKHLYSIDDIKMFGLPSVQDVNIDYQMQNQLTDVMITINAMVEYFKKGVTVYVPVHKDTKLIYDIIEQYLLAWKEKLDRGINIAVAPLDDLQLLDKFAEKIYPHAREHMKATDGLTSFLASIGNIGKIGNKSMPTQIISDTVYNTGEVSRSYNSLADVLAERVIRRINPTNGTSNINSNENKDFDQNQNNPFTFKHRWQE